MLVSHLPKSVPGTNTPFPSGDNMLILAKDDSAIGLAVFLTVAVVLIPLIWLLYRKVKASADKAVDEQLTQLNLKPRSIKSSWFPPARHLLRHRKGVLWYTITLTDGRKKYARVYMFLTMLVSIDLYD